MRNQGRDGSPQVDPNHGETGQTGHETGHASLRSRLRRRLSDGLKGLAHGVLADEIEGLQDELREARAEVVGAAARVAELEREIRAECEYSRGALEGAAVENAEFGAACLQMQDERDEARAEVERLKAEVDAWKAKADRLKAERDRDDATAAEEG